MQTRAQLDRLAQGFTLIELLLYIGISSSVLLLTALLLGTTLEASVKNQTISEVDQQGTFAMDTILRTIRNASSISSPGSGVTLGSLTIAVSVPAENPTTFSLSGGALRVQKGVASPMALTSNTVAVSGVSFQNLSSVGSPGNIRVVFTITRTNVSGRGEYSYSKTFVGTASLRHP